MTISEELLPPPKKSWMDVLAKAPEEKRQSILNALKDEEAAAIDSDWFLKARREQIEPPGAWWLVWIIMAGRGFGKNFAGSNWLIEQHMNQGAQNSVIVAATANDLRNYCIEGPSGVLPQAPKHFKPRYVPSKNQLQWPNGTITTLISSEKPNRLRGGNFDRAWCDELSHWQSPDRVWSMLQFALRYGNHVKAVVTMTPRPIQIVKDLIGREGEDVVVTRGATYDNQKNLSQNYIETVIKPYEGTTLGRQELQGEVLMDVEGALWDHAMIDQRRVDTHPQLYRVGIGIDPATTSSETADDTGIVAAGITKEKLGYVLGDHSLHGRPDQWAQKAVQMYYHYEADFIVAESNQGGEMVESILRNIDPSVNVKLVRASRGKVARAEPVSALYEQGRVFHAGTFPDLEDQMAMFVPGDMKESPDRVDALVWVLTELMVGKKRGRAGLWPSSKKVA